MEWKVKGCEIIPELACDKIGRRGELRKVVTNCVKGNGVKLEFEWDQIWYNKVNLVKFSKKTFCSENYILLLSYFSFLFWIIRIKIGRNSALTFAKFSTLMPRQSWRKGTQCAENHNFVRKLNFYIKSAKKWIWIFLQPETS